MSKPPKHASTKRLRDDVRAAGLRATASRIAVLQVMRAAARPLSHADVADALAGSSWDRATIYRNLVDLTEAGLLRRAALVDRVWRFEDAADQAHDTRQHPHFVCVECGEIECLPGARVTVDAASHAPDALRGGEVEVQVRGLCDGCMGPH